MNMNNSFYEESINEHFFEIMTEDGYKVDYDKIKNSKEEEVLEFLSNITEIREELFYPLYIYTVINSQKMSKEYLVKISEYLSKIVIIYRDVDKDTLNWNKAKCGACKGFLRVYISENKNTNVKKLIK